VWGIEESPWGSGLLVLLFVTAVVAFGAVWQRRTFCRYLCFVGGLSGNYARTSVVELRANGDICKGCGSRAACYNGTDRVAGCPLFSFPRTMESTAHCNLCGNCVKNCSDGAIQLRLRKPMSELWFIRRPRFDESFLAAAIMGVVLVQNAESLDVWARLLDWLRAVTAVSNDPVLFTVVFAGAVTLPVGLLALASRVAVGRTRESLRTNFTRFGYALIPLDVAGHVAHTLSHVLGEGKAVWLTALPLIGRHPAPGSSAALTGTGTIRLVQCAVVGLGIAASVYTALRITRSRHHDPRNRRATLLPYAVLIAGLGVANLILLTLPPARGT
jgi:ferredoxin